MVNEYEYEPIGTMLTDLGNGKLVLVFGRPADDLKEVYDQALWVEKVLDQLHKNDEKEKYTMLVDLEKLMLLRLDQKSRDKYKEIIKQPYLKQIALVGDAVNYTKVLPLLAASRFRRSKIKFFFRIKEAHDWLKWDK